jgi:hypothetical protein
MDAGFASDFLLIFTLFCVLTLLLPGDYFFLFFSALLFFFGWLRGRGQKSKRPPEAGQPASQPAPAESLSQLHELLSNYQSLPY